MRSRGRLPVLDGLFGPLLTGRPNAVLKGILILTSCDGGGLHCSHVGAAGAMGSGSHRFRTHSASSRDESNQIWVVARFSRLLVVPVAVALMFSPTGRALFENKTVYATVMAACIATNLAFIYYVVRIFFA